MTDKANPKVSFIWHPDPVAGDERDEHNAVVVREITRLIKAGKRDKVSKALRRWPPPHLVALFVRLPLKRARTLVGWLDGFQVRVVAALNPAFRAAPLTLATSAGLSLLRVVIAAVLVGATIPILLDRLGIDPAMATGVFITNGNDIRWAMIFFALMSLFYLPLLA